MDKRLPRNSLRRLPVGITRTCEGPFSCNQYPMAVYNPTLRGRRSVKTSENGANESQPTLREALRGGLPARHKEAMNHLNLSPQHSVPNAVGHGWWLRCARIPGGHDPLAPVPGLIGATRRNGCREPDAMAYVILSPWRHTHVLSTRSLARPHQCPSVRIPAPR